MCNGGGHAVAAADPDHRGRYSGRERTAAAGISGGSGGTDRRRGLSAGASLADRGTARSSGAALGHFPLSFYTF